MKKKYIVRSTRDFDLIIKNGICIKNKHYVIYFKKNNLLYDRFGISVSKKLGNAVFRNKYKRKLRAIIDNYKKMYINNEDYIIILRKDAINQNYKILENSFFNLIKEAQKGIKSNE